MLGSLPCSGGHRGTRPPQHLHLQSPAALPLPSTATGRYRQQPAVQDVRHSIKCMAHPRRVAKVSKQIKREIGSLLLSDEKMQTAVHSSTILEDDSLSSPITTVSEVQMSSDLSVAKVFVNTNGDDEQQAATLEKLSKLQGYVRKHIGHTMSLRMTPEIRFLKDEFSQRGEQVLAALDQVRLQREGKISPPPIAISRNVRAAIDRARQQGQDASPFHFLDDANKAQGADDEFDSLLEDEDDDEVGDDDDDEDAAEVASDGLNLDEFFRHERQLTMARPQGQRPIGRLRRGIRGPS